MAPTRPPPNLAELLTHADWVKGLARELVRDEHRADDVVQETWVAALRRPPSDASNVRGWLATVVRNVVRGRTRADVRRIKREVEGARPEAVPPEHEVAERARLQHELVEHVLALDEPYRAVLLLRYFDALPPRTIAVRIGIPVATVRTRHARGLEKLRERLTREHGGAEEWNRELSALAAGLPAATAAGVIATGGLWMGTQVKLWSAVAGIVLSLTALWLFTRDDLVQLTANEPNTSAAVTVAEAPIAESRPVAERTAVTPPAPEHANPSAKSLAQLEHGIVLDTHGRPVPEAIMMQVPADETLFERGISPEGMQRRLAHPAYAGSPSETRMRAAIALLDDPTIRVPVDAQGRFELAQAGEKPTRLIVWQSGWANVASGRRVDASGVAERVLVIERTVSLGGEVVDASGAGVPNAWVDPQVALQAVGTFPASLHDIENRSLSLTEFTDTAGRFTLIGLPCAAGVRLMARAEGFRDAASPALVEDFSNLIRIVLQRIPDSNWIEIEGRVVGAQGEGLEQAMVYFIDSHTLTDERGAFRVRIQKDNPRVSMRGRAGVDRLSHDLVAVYPGLQPAILADFVSVLDDPAARTGIVLHLDEPALAITGMVTDDEGHPRPGVEIVLADPTPMGLTSMTTEVQARQQKTNWIGDAKIVTDQNGRFEVAGLSARPYSIAACDRERLVAIQSGPIVAGTRDLVLREPAAAWHERVRGQVTTRSGRPLRGVRLVIELRVESSNKVMLARDIDTTRTDSDGRFEFARVPKAMAVLDVTGDAVESQRVPVSEIVPGSEWRIIAAAKARFRIETPAQVGAKTVGLLDAQGNELRIEVLRADNQKVGYQRVPSAALSGSVCSADDAAATLVVYGEHGEIHRMAIRLSPEELTVLRP